MSGSPYSDEEIAAAEAEQAAFESMQSHFGQNHDFDENDEDDND